LKCEIWNVSVLPGFHPCFQSPQQFRCRSECRLAQMVECRNAIEQTLFISEIDQV
jgi:hypothetical protein